MVEDNDDGKQAAKAIVSTTNTDGGAAQTAPGNPDVVSAEQSPDAAGKYIQEKMIDIQINQLEE